MGWRDRAIPDNGQVEAQPVPDDRGWKSRAVSVDPMSAGKAAILGAASGGTFGFADELGGLYAKAFPDALRPYTPNFLTPPSEPVRVNTAPEPGDSEMVAAAKQQIASEQNAVPSNYELVRDHVRAEQEKARRDHGGAYLAGEIGGGVAASFLPGMRALNGAGKALGLGAKLGRAAATGAGMGALYGAGSSNTNLSDGNIKEVGGFLVDTTTGAVLGAAGSVLGEGAIAAGGAALNGARRLLASGAGVVDDLGKSAELAAPKIQQMLKERAEQGIQEAKDLAQAKAAKETADDLSRLRGSSGGERQKANRLAENIERLEVDPTLPAAESPMRLRLSAEAAMGKAKQLRSEAFASGVEEGSIQKVGEFLSAGSKLDKAQKAIKDAATYEEAATAMMKRADELERPALGSGSSSIVPAGATAKSEAQQMVESAAAKRQALMSEPTFNTDKARLLESNMDEWPEAVAKADAAREAYRQAIAGADDKVAERAQELLSPAAATKRFRELALRYGAPLAGSMVGSMLGGPAGAVAGGAVGMATGGFSHAMGALGGGGLRPGLQALYRTATQYPAVKLMGWQAVKRIAEANPAALGEFARPLTSALARGDQAFAATQYALAHGNPAFRSLMQTLGRTPVSGPDDETGRPVTAQQSDAR